MPLVQAKCTNCGANLEINNTLDAAVCPYCGAAFIVEKDTLVPFEGSVIAKTT